MTYDNPQPGEVGHDERKKDDDPASKNPTGNKRKSSARTRGKKDRRLFGGTPWAKPKPPEDPKGKK